jgi:Domain of unknown function (DUF4429)
LSCKLAILERLPSGADSSGSVTFSRPTLIGSRDQVQDAHMKYAGCNGTITVEGDVLILTREGMIARAQGLAGPPRRIPLHAISGVFLKDSTRLLDGHLTLGLGGASAAEHAASGAADDPDTVVFRRKDQDAFRALHDWLVTVVKENSEQGIDPSTVIYDVGRSSVEAALEVNGFGNQDNKAGDAATNRFLTDRSKLHSELNRELDVNLSPGETVEVIISGPSNQTVIGTDRRVFIYKKGFMAGAAFGFEMTSWDYRNLNGVQLHTGMMSGAVVIQAQANPGRRQVPGAAETTIPTRRPTRFQFCGRLTKRRPASRSFVK